MIIARRFLRNHWGKALGLLAIGGFLTVVWWALPVQPRISWTLMEPNRIVGFAVGGQCLVIQNELSTVGRRTLGPLIWLDVERGAVLKTLANDGFLTNG